MESEKRILALQQGGDTTFWRDLERSQPYVAAIRRMHQGGGAMTGSYPMQRYRDGQDHDMHDIAVASPEEVKSRSFNFDSLESLAKAGRDIQGWPYPAVIIDTCHHVDGNLERFGSWPACYWIWSADRGHVLRVDTAATYYSWARQWFKVRGRNRAHYVCPLFMGASGCLYTAAALAESMCKREFRGSVPVRGLEILSAGDLRAKMTRGRNRKRRIIQDLQESPWVKDGQVMRENPGCAA